MAENDCRRDDEKSEIIALITRARMGSAEAVEALLLRYRPLIESETRKHYAEGMTEQDARDLRQEAEICFRMAVCNYDLDEDGVEFGLYAKICIRNGLVSFIRGLMKRSSSCVMSLDEDSALYDRLSQSGDLLQSLIEEESFDSLRARIQSALSPYENRVWWRYVSGMKSSDIAATLGEDLRSVSNAIYRIRKKLRKLFEM